MVFGVPVLDCWSVCFQLIYNFLLLISQFLGENILHLVNIIFKTDAIKCINVFWVQLTEIVSYYDIFILDNTLTLQTCIAQINRSF